MSVVFPNPFSLPLQGRVPANGILEVFFGPPLNINWTIEQVSIKMLTAPSGSACDLYQMGSLHAPAHSARKATFANGDVYLNAGETMSVRWTGCTPGDIGEVLVNYRKVSF